MDQSAAAWRVLDAEPQEGGIDTSGSGTAGAQATSWRRFLPILAIAAAVVLGIGAFVVAAAGARPIADVAGAEPFDSDAPGGAGGAAIRPSAPGKGGLLVVDVQGAVVHPGVVRLVAGSRVGDAIAAAGGYGPRVAADRVGQVLNLAALLRDGDKVVVPSRDDPAAGAAGSASGSSSGGAGGGGSNPGPASPVDLNRATASELDALPGIGPVTAAKIIASRDEQLFAAVDDLRTRKLVGAATFDKLKGLVAVR